MKFKKLLVLSLVLMLSVGLLVGCGSGEAENGADAGEGQNDAGETPNDAKPKVAFSISTLNNPYFVTVFNCYNIITLDPAAIESLQPADVDTAKEIMYNLF